MAAVASEQPEQLPRVSTPDCGLTRIGHHLPVSTFGVHPPSRLVVTDTGPQSRADQVSLVVYKTTKRSVTAFQASHPV